MGVCFQPGIWKTLTITGLWPKAALIKYRDDQTQQTLGLAQLKHPAAESLRD